MAEQQLNCSQVFGSLVTVAFGRPLCLCFGCLFGLRIQLHFSLYYPPQGWVMSMVIVSSLVDVKTESILLGSEVSLDSCLPAAQ